METIQNHAYGEPPFLVQATSNSPGAITYSLVSGNATVTSAGLVALTGVGSVSIEASQAAAPNFTSAVQTATFLVTPGAPSINFNVSNATDTAPFPVAASSPSTGAFTYSVLSGPAKITGNMVSLTGTGQVVLEASEAADANYAAGSKTASFTLGGQTLVVTANNASRLYGAQNPTFNGSIAGSSPLETFVESFTTAANPTSSPGSYPVIPAASGPDLADYKIDTMNGTLTITQAPTLTTISTSSTTIDPSQPLTLSSQVTSTTTGVPSGSVSFFDNGVALQTVPLVNGSASLTTSLSAATIHVLTASFSGDANFLASTQSPGITLAAGSQDFAFANQGSPVAASVPGEMASYTFRIAPLSGNFGAPVTFTVRGLPDGASATFTPSTLAADAGPSTVKLYVQTAPQTAHENNKSRTPAGRGIAALATALFLTFTSSRKLRQTLHGRVLALLLMGMGLSGTVFLAGCGSGILQQTSSTYSLSVVATSGTLQHTQDVTLAMQ